MRKPCSVEDPFSWSLRVTAIDKCSTFGDAVYLSGAKRAELERSEDGGVRVITSGQGKWQQVIHVPLTPKYDFPRHVLGLVSQHVSEPRHHDYEVKVIASQGADYTQYTLHTSNLLDGLSSALTFFYFTNFKPRTDF